MRDELKTPHTARQPGPGDGIDWPELGNLEQSLAPLPDIDADAIPANLRSWVLDAAARLGVPANTIYTAALVGAGAIIGNTVRVYPRARDTAWSEPANLWGVLIGRPSTKKSAIGKQGLTFVREIDSELVHRYEREEPARRAELAGIESRIKAQLAALESAERASSPEAIDRSTQALKALEGKRAITRTARPQLVANDVSVEVLQVLMEENPNGVLFFRDELSGLLQKMESQGHENDRAFFTEAYNASDPYTVNRIGRKTVRIETPTLSLYGTIQPSVIKPLIDQTVRAAGGDGFLARCQLSVELDAKAVGNGTDGDVDQAAETAAREANRALHRTAKRAVEDAVKAPWRLRFSPDAQEHMDAWRGKLDALMRSGDLDHVPAFLAHLGKSGAAACRIALVIELLKQGDGATSVTTISLEAARQATHLMDHLRLHAQRIYRVDERPHLDDGRYLMAKIRDGTVRDGTTTRDIQNACSRFRSAHQLDAALELLQDFGVLRTEVVRRSGGRGSTIVRVHPDLRHTSGGNALN